MALVTESLIRVVERVRYKVSKDDTDRRTRTASGLND